MYLIFSAVLFSIYLANVVIGAFDGPRFLADVGEMLVLFSAAIAFTATILRREAQDKDSKKIEP